MGGGSTDISVTLIDENHQKVIRHLSLPFAAQYIFSAGAANGGVDSLEILSHLSAGLVDRNGSFNAEVQDLVKRKDPTISTEAAREYVLLSSMFRMLPPRDANYDDPLINDDPTVYAQQEAYNGLVRLARTDKSGRLRLQLDSYLSNLNEFIRALALHRGNDGASATQEIIRELLFMNNGNGPKGFRQRLASVNMTAFAIAYFVGLILNEVLREEKNLVGKVDLYLAGNGSRVFDWVVDSGGAGTATETILAGYVKAALDSKHSDIDINVYKSEYPKQEVAYGLLYADAPLDLLDNNTGNYEFFDIDKRIHEIGEEIHKDSRISGNDRRSHKLKRVQDEIEDAIGRKSSKGINEALSDEAAANGGVALKDVKDIKGLYERYTKLLNPEFNKANIKEQIARFLSVLCKESKDYFLTLFGVNQNAISTDWRKDEVIGKLAEAVCKYIMDVLEYDPDNRSEGKLPIGARGNNAYAVLKLATGMLRKDPDLLEALSKALV
jgi:hypothetical protein